MAHASAAPQLGRPSLPTTLTRFVGRATELTEIAGLLAERRLVTVTGPGGCGKTRLALEVLTRLTAGDDGDPGAAEPGGPGGGGPGGGGAAGGGPVRWPDGAWWVDLVPATDASRVAESAAAAVGALVEPAGGPIAALTGHLRDRGLVLCLDNCEHVVDGCAELVEALLRACPGVTVLATSREPLGVPGETVWRVPPLAETEAVDLFGERARLVNPTFAGDAVDRDAVLTVCRRLDGMPLAIELAAAWVRMLTPSQISAALDDRFRLLVGGPRGAVARQRALEASVDWSYNLLREDARILLRRLAVFSGGFTLEAAEAVCGTGDLAADRVLTVLGGLVDSSMVVVSDRGGFARYRLLETIRAYADDRLADAGESESVRDRHLAHFLALAETGAAALDNGETGETGDTGDAGREGEPDAALAAYDAVLAGLEREHDNLRAALRWGLSRPDPGPGRRIALALGRLWLVHGQAGEGIELLGAAVDTEPGDRSTLQADLLSALALLGAPTGRLDLSVRASARAVELAEASGDDRSLARAYGASCYVPFYVDYERAEKLGRLARRHGEAAGDAFTAGWGSLMEAASLMNRDRLAESVVVAQAAHDVAARRGDRFLMAMPLGVVMHEAVLTGDVRRAVRVATEAVRIAEPLNDYFVFGTSKINLAWARGVLGDVAAARRLIEPVVRAVEAAGRDVDVINIGLIEGQLLLWHGDLEGAVDWLTRATRFAEPLGASWTSVRAFPHLSGALRRLGRLDEAAEWATRGIEAGRRLGTVHSAAEALDALAFLVVDEDPGRAEELHREALAIRVDRGIDTYVADSLDAFARLSAAAERWDEAARLLGASDAARERMGYPRLAIDAPAHASLVDAVRSGLGDDAFAAETAAGAALPLADAVALVSRARGPRGRPSIGWASLTPAERQVVALVVEGLTNPGIAGRLFVSRATVKTHLSHIYAKLGVANRTELAAAARSPEADLDPDG